MTAITTSEVEEKPDLKKLTTGNLPIWWIKLTNWEFWPFNLFYLPLYFYAAWLMIKARSFFFFSASNPGIEYGGMLGESKIKILNHFSSHYKPKTYLLQPGVTQKEIDKILLRHQLSYPIILKPDIGERGWMVKKINNKKQLVQYLNQIKVPFLLQEYVDSPIEMGVFYYKMPSEESGHVTSIVLKEMMSVIGDGVSNVGSLLLKKPRSVITLREIEKTSGDLFKYVPGDKEEVEVVPIGNHCRGTTFLNGSHLINEKVRLAIDHAAKQHPGFYFGRFDLRCNSPQALERGEFKIFELNGCGAEPGHIYQPGYPLFKAYKELIFHLNLMYQIAKENREKGIPYMSFKEGIQLIQFLRRYNKLKD